jgi:hypothetical protein
LKLTVSQANQMSCQATFSLEAAARGPIRYIQHHNQSELPSRQPVIPKLKKPPPLNHLHLFTSSDHSLQQMDLKHLLNPLPDPPSPSSAPPSRPKTPSEQLPAPITAGYIHSRFYLSPRRLDPETASVSTNSSTKRRRTNRGRVDVDRRAGPVPGAGVAMGRTFSELEVPSDESSNDEGQEAVKRGVAQLSLSGKFFRVDTDELTGGR